MAKYRKSRFIKGKQGYQQSKLQAKKLVNLKYGNDLFELMLNENLALHLQIKKDRENRKKYFKIYKQKYQISPKGKLQQKIYQQKYNQRPEVKLRQKIYHQRPEVKLRQKIYHQRPEVKLRQKIAVKKYSQKPEIKQQILLRARLYQQRPEIKERQRLQRIRRNMLRRNICSF